MTWLARIALGPACSGRNAGYSDTAVGYGLSWMGLHRHSRHCAVRFLEPSGLAELFLGVSEHASGYSHSEMQRPSSPGLREAPLLSAYSAAGVGGVVSAAMLSLGDSGSPEPRSPAPRHCPAFEVRLKPPSPGMADVYIAESEVGEWALACGGLRGCSAYGATLTLLTGGRKQPCPSRVGRWP